MPFGLKFKRTRRYDISTKNVFVVGVEMLDHSFLECTLNSDSTGQECLESIAQRIELSQVCAAADSTTVFFNGEFSLWYCTSMFVIVAVDTFSLGQVRSCIYCNACVDIHIIRIYIHVYITDIHVQVQKIYMNCAFNQFMSYTVQTLVWASEKNIDAFIFDKTNLLIRLINQTGCNMTLIHVLLARALQNLKCSPVTMKVQL